MPETVSKLSDVCHLPKNTIRCILQQAARVAISCSYRIFNSRASTTWDVLDLFTSGEVLGVFLGFPETPSEIVCAPTICLGDKNYRELYILYYIMALFLLAKLHTFTSEITIIAFAT